MTKLDSLIKQFIQIRVKYAAQVTNYTNFIAVCGKLYRINDQVNLIILHLTFILNVISSNLDQNQQP
jgi:hypothetical protein